MESFGDQGEVPKLAQQKPGRRSKPKETRNGASCFLLGHFVSELIRCQCFAQNRFEYLCLPHEAQVVGMRCIGRTFSVIPV